jgi:hypothetical protein
MGLAEILTIVFVVLKLMDVISWSWWLVLLPEIIAVGLYIIWFVVVTVFIGKTHKRVSKSFKTDFWD